MITATFPERKRRRHGGRPAVMLEHDGCTLSITDWAKRQGISRYVISQRLAAGMSVADALTKPLGRRGIPLWKRKGSDDHELPPIPREPEVPATIAELAADAASQIERSQGTEPVVFLTTISGEPPNVPHVHRAILDEHGNGWTEPDDTSHRHEVVGFVVMATNHTHGLSVP